MATRPRCRLRELPLLLALAVLSASPVGWCQSNNQPIQQGKYYMDSLSYCNGPVKEIYGQEIQVIGHGAIQEQDPPESCTLIFKSSANYDQTNLQITVAAANIRDCNVRLSIYDGDPDGGKLKGYDCNSGNKVNENEFISTGDVVSFILQRQSAIDSLFDIQIFIKPGVSGVKPGYENNYGDAWGYFREKLQNDIAVGIVGTIFLITIVLITITIIFCYRKYRGSNKPWERHQLSTFRPPAGTSIYETKSRMSDTSSNMWVSNASRGRADPPRHRVEPNRHMARPSEDEDSVFDDASDLPPKKQLMERDRRWERERERERDRHRGRGREYATQNSSFVQADDDHPQDTFVERIIEPRVRPGRLHRPPSYEEALNETETERSDLDDDEDEKDGEETSEEEEESSDDEKEPISSSEEEAKAPRAKPKPAARPQAQPPLPPTAIPMQPGMQAYPGYPPPMGYMGSYPVPPGQFVPIVTAPPSQPYPSMAPGPGHPPPQYPGERGAPRAVRPTDPPIYSYLVQRGYTPLDPGRESPASMANTSHSQASMDDSDKNVLDSGVEYMRR